VPISNSKLVSPTQYPQATFVPPDPEAEVQTLSRIVDEATMLNLVGISLRFLTSHCFDVIHKDMNLLCKLNSRAQIPFRIVDRWEKWLAGSLFRD